MATMSISFLSQAFSTSRQQNMDPKWTSVLKSLIPLKTKRKYGHISKKESKIRKSVINEREGRKQAEGLHSHDEHCRSVAYERYSDMA